jgi:hypothetical protein
MAAPSKIQQSSALKRWTSRHISHYDVIVNGQLTPQ